MTLTTAQLENWIVKGEALIAALPPPSTPALIYGYGVFGRDLYRTLTAAGANVIGFVDANKAGMVSTESGRKILSPAEIPADHLLIQSINNPSFSVTKINEQLRSHCARLLNPLEALWWGSGQLLWSALPGDYRPHLARIVSAWERMHPDDQTCYASAWHDRLSGSFGQLYSATQDPYFPTDLPYLPSVLNLIDCGAYDGDVARDALRRGFKLNHLVAFEPDATNFSRLVAWAEQHRNEIGTTLTLPIATGDFNDVVSFAGGLSTSSHLATDGNRQITCIRLDDVLVNYPANYLKLDVEGAEAATLRGATRLIRRCRPALAISVYHRPNDLFELIELIDEIEPTYRFHLRFHALAGVDSVLYAFPRNGT